MTKEDILLCKKFGFEFTEQSAYIYVKSKYDSWRIVKEDVGYRLYHRNKSRKGYDCCLMEDYHHQKECKDTSSVESIIRYIKKHDKAVIKNYKGETSIERLFDKMENPKKMKMY